MSELNKTDFIQYLNCPKSLWLMLHKPIEFSYGEFTAYQQKLTTEGYEVEAHVQALVGSFADKSQYDFQRVFENDHLYAKADMVRNKDGTIDLYEIKSSTSVKDGNPHNQLKDAAFQAIVADQCGHKIGKIFIIHLNKEYRRDGEIDAAIQLHTTTKPKIEKDTTINRSATSRCSRLEIMEID